jgi:ATP-dependent helicase/nuclease subunit B
MFFPFEVEDPFSRVKYRLSSTRLAELSLAPRQGEWNPPQVMRADPDPVWAQSLATAPAETIAAVTAALEDLVLATDDLKLPAIDRLPDSRMRNHLAALLRLWERLGDALPEGLGAVRHVLGLPKGRFLDHLPVVEGSLDPLAPAAMRKLYDRLRDEFGFVPAKEKPPLASAGSRLRVLQGGLSQPDVDRGPQDSTVALHGLRDTHSCAGFAAAKARALIENGNEARDIAVITAGDPRHIVRAFAGQGVPLSGLPGAPTERDHAGETLLHLLLAKRPAAPAMVLASLCLSPFMPWDTQTARDLAEVVMKGKSESEIQKAFPLQADFLKDLRASAGTLSQLRYMIGKICRNLQDGKILEARLAPLIEGEGSPDWEKILRAVQVAAPKVAEPARNIEGVSLWSAHESPWRPCRHLIVMDFSEGLYPSRPASNPIFLDSEIASIQKLTGLQLRGGAQNLARGLQLFEEQLRAVSHSVTFLIPRRDLAGSRIAPSAGLWLVGRAIAGVQDATDLIADIPRAEPETWPVGHHFPEPNPPVHPVPEALEFGSRKLLALRKDHAGNALLQSPSRLETLIVSPLAWLLAEIGAEDMTWSAEELDVLTAGNIAHQVFEHVFAKDVDPPENEDLKASVSSNYKLAVGRYAPFLRGPQWQMEHDGLERDIFRAAVNWRDILRDVGARVLANEMSLGGHVHTIDLRGKADSILELPDSTLLLVDYKKSGTSRRRKRMEAGWDLQAGLYRDMIVNPSAQAGEEMKALFGRQVGLAYYLINDSGLLTSGVALPSNVRAQDMGGSINDRAVERLRERLDDLGNGRVRLNTTADEKFFEEKAGIKPYALTDGSPLVKAFMQETGK